jgi:uncharacterized caspase-like protein
MTATASREGCVRFLQFITVAWLALIGALAPVHADKRVALVVGNAAYRHADRLTNPVNDARAMRDALKSISFDVTYGEDLDQKALRRAIGRFAGSAAGADVAIVYFAGHGATFGDTPYVVPVDAEFSSLTEAPYEMIPVETLIGELRQAKGVRIAILDACRDNAAERDLKRARGGGESRGLAPMKNATGLIIAYATQHGATAADNAGGRNSPFTAALLNNIATPGLDVTDMFRKVGRDVGVATAGRQRPEISISMYEQYALVPGAAKQDTVLDPGRSLPPAVSEAERVWSGGVKDTASLAVLEDFVRRYPDTIFGTMAQARLEELRKQQAAAASPATKPAAPQVAAIASGRAGVDIIARMQSIKDKGGSGEWDDEIKKLMLAKYDLDGSGAIDTPEEVDRIDCAVWSMLDQQIRSGSRGYDLLITYGFKEGFGWVGGALGFDEKVRQSALKRARQCGVTDKH